MHPTAGLPGSRPDPRQNEIDAGQELRALVVRGQLRRHLAHERVLRRVELRPPIGHGRDDLRLPRLARMQSCAGRVLAGQPEDVVHQRRCRVELRGLRHAQRLKLPPDALENPQHRLLPWLPEQLRAHPRMRAERVEQAQRDAPERLRRIVVTLRRHVRQRTRDHLIRGRRQQVVLVGDVPVDRAASGCQLRGKRAERQRALACMVEDSDRSLDDPLFRQRIRAPLGPVAGFHAR